MAADVAVDDLAKRKRLLSRFRAPLFLLMLFVGFCLTLDVLSFLYPDAGADMLLLLPVAFVAAFAIAIIAWLLYIALSALKWWAGIPLLGLAAIAGLLITIRLVHAAPAVAANAKPACLVYDVKPAADSCTVLLTVPPRTNPARDLFAAHGWTVATGTARPWQIPEQLSLLWSANAEFSRDIGLDFRSEAGQQVQHITFPVKGQLELAGPGEEPCDARGGALVRADGAVIGAWIECLTSTVGQSRVVPGYSLRGRNIETLIGSSWTWYRLKYEL